MPSHFCTLKRAARREQQTPLFDRADAWRFAVTACAIAALFYGLAYAFWVILNLAATVLAL